MTIRKAADESPGPHEITLQAEDVLRFPKMQANIGQQYAVGFYAKQKLAVGQQDDQGARPTNGKGSPGGGCDHRQVPSDATMQDVKEEAQRTVMRCSCIFLQ